MSINKIQGNILADDLVRGGNLTFQGNLLVLDVGLKRVGIGTNDLSYQLTVDQATSTQYLNLRSANANGILYFDDELFALTSNNFLFDGGNLTLIGNANISSITAGNIDVGNISIEELAEIGNALIGNATITGNLEAESISANLDIVALGNILTSSDIIAQGNIQANSGSFSSNLAVDGTATIGDVFADYANVSGNIDAGNLAVVGLITTDIIEAIGNSSIISNLTFTDTTISSVNPTANIVITPTGNSLAIIDVTSGLALPAGNITERPLSPPIGTFRYNTELGRVEIYDGVQWDQVVSDVTNQILYGDDSTIVFTLDKDATTAALLVAFNGVIQLPGVAYTVTGNQITFAQAPAVSDTIDIRFL